MHKPAVVMNPGRTPKTRPVWPTLPVKIARRIKLGVNGYFQGS